MPYELIQAKSMQIFYFIKNTFYNAVTDSKVQYFIHKSYVNIHFEFSHKSDQEKQNKMREKK